MDKFGEGNSFLNGKVKAIKRFLKAMNETVKLTIILQAAF